MFPLRSVINNLLPLPEAEDTGAKRVTRAEETRVGKKEVP